MRITKVNSGNSMIHSNEESEKAQTVARDAKGIPNNDRVLRRSVIDQDLDQNQKSISIKQQILEYPSGS